MKMMKSKYAANGWKPLLLSVIMLGAWTLHADDSCKGPGSDGEGGDDSRNEQSFDPNEMAGPLGVGQQRYVRAGQWMNYIVFFENLETADVPAQEVRVNAVLSEYLDWSTFELGEIVFNHQVERGLLGVKSGTITVPQNNSQHSVKITFDLNQDTGEVVWYLRSYDPTRMQYGFWPSGVNDGFLPPNDETGRGEGHLAYRVKLRDDVPPGAVIHASAEIIFDHNEMIPTDPAWWNTVASGVVLDAGAGSVGEDWLMTAGETYGTLPAAARDGYAFGGWFTEPDGQGRRIASFDAVDGGIGTLHAKWTPIPGAVNGKAYKLTVKGGTPATGTFLSGDPVTVTANAPGAGMVFANWSGAVSLADSSANPVSFRMPPANVTLTANYAREDAIVVSYRIGEGVGLGTVTVSPASGVVAVDTKGNRKTVTLAAKPIKDALFIGWTDEAGNVYSTASIKVNPAVSTVYTARFRLKADTLPPTVATTTFTGDPWADLMVGVPFRAQVSVPDEMRPVKFSAKALPSGLKLNAASGEVAGVPSKANNFATVFTVASLANAKAVATISRPLTVAPLNPRAQGTWQGYLWEGGATASRLAEDVSGLMTFTVSAAGKVSAKAATAGGAVSFSGASWGARDGEVFTFTGATKKSETLSVTVDASKGHDETQLEGTLQTAAGTFTVVAQRNAMATKTDPDRDATVAWLTGAGGYYTFAFVPGSDGVVDIGLAENIPLGHGYAGVTVSGKTPSPTAKVIGKLADGTALSGSFPVLNSGGNALLPLFATPYKTGLFAGVAEGVAAGLFEGVAVWNYPGKSPAAKPPQTEDRFTVQVDIFGGWYGSWADVAGHYANSMLVAHGVPPCLITHDAKGNLIVEKGGVNTNNVTLSVVPATGVFKGKADVWPEGAAKPVSVSYEGILTPWFGADYLGLGFYLLNDPQSATYPTKRSLPVVIERE